MLPTWHPLHKSLFYNVKYVIYTIIIYNGGGSGAYIAQVENKGYFLIIFSSKLAQ